MPLFSILRFLTTLLSLAILGTAGYLLWSWYQGEWLTDANGALYRVRNDWRLWTALGLLAWSFLGRAIMLPLLARSDKRRTSPERGAGQTVVGASGSTIYVEHHGPVGAPPIIFTHGWGLDSTIWRYAKEDLGDRFRLVLWDLPGLGRSKAPADGHISLEDFAADLGALLSASGGPAVLVGHSIGGMTIQTLVRDHPELSDRIAGVVLLNTTYTNPLKTMVLSGLAQALRKPILEPAMRLTIWLQPIAWLSQWQSYLSGSAHLAHRLGFGKFVTRSQLEHSVLLSTRNPPGMQAKGDLAMFRWDATAALARSQKPMLVVGGDKDIVTKLEASRKISQDTPTAKLEIVQGVNHMGFLERADLYNQLIADFTLAVQPRARLDRRSFASADPSSAEADSETRPDGPDRAPPPARLH
jgi:pimeloyl-ACP methyl ester carboxylesterase